MTAFFTGPGSFGWTETLFDSPGSYTSTLQKADTVWRPARLGVLSNLFSLRQIRVSDEAINRDSLVKSYTAIQGLGLIAQGTDTNQGGGDWGPASPQAFPAPNALLVRLEATAAFRRMFLMRGMPVAAFGGDVVFNPNGTFTGNFIALATALNGQWFLKNLVPTGGPQQASALTVSASQLAMTLTFPSATGLAPAGWAPNGILKLSLFRNAAFVNGLWKIFAINPSTPDATHFQVVTFSKRRQIQGTPIPGFATLLIPQFTAISATIALRGTTRKTGRPFGLPRGKSRVRLS
jgi:hypothetical protein